VARALACVPDGAKLSAHVGVPASPPSAPASPPVPLELLVLEVLELDELVVDPLVLEELVEVLPAPFPDPDVEDVDPAPPVPEVELANSNVPRMAWQPPAAIAAHAARPAL
jgi:hypothetical protein